MKNVDTITDRAKKSGAKVEHQPFDITGVGRESVIEDPQGALIGPFIPSHGFPPPNGYSCGMNYLPVIYMSL